MRILIIPSQYPKDTLDHAGIFVRDQSAVLALRHEVTVLIPVLMTPRGLLRRRRVHAPLAAPAPLPNAAPGSRHEIPVSILNLTNRWQGLTHRRWHHRMVASARRLVATGRIPVPDIVHAHFVRPAGGVAVALGRLWPARTVLTEHSGPFAVHLHPPAVRRATDTVLHSVDRVIAVSPFLANEIRGAWSDLSPTVVGNVVDEEYFSPEPNAPSPASPRPFRFLFVGGLTWHKGVTHLLEAAARLRQRTTRSWQLAIAGDGPDRGALEAQARQAGLTGHVSFVGQLPRDEVRSRMRSADLLVHPSLIETFGVVLIEAMACGVPVIATDCGGPSWIIRPETGRLVPARDPEALTDAMADALLGKTPLKGNAVRDAVVSRFGRQAWLADIERVYATLPPP